MIKEVKNTVPYTYIINYLTRKEIIGTFYEKKLQKTNQQEFRIEKVINRSGDKLYVEWKGYDNSFKMSQYFPKPYEPFGRDINVKVDLSNYATKTDLKNVSHVDVSSFALKINFASLKTKVDRLDIDKLVPIPIDLSKLTNVIKNDVVKKMKYDKLVAKVNDIDTTKFVSKTKYKNDGSVLEKKKISDVDKKNPDISGLVKKNRFQC